MPQIMASFQEGKEKDLQPAGWAVFWGFCFFLNDNCYFLRGMQNSQHLLMKGVWKENFKNNLDICNLSDCE